jgi:hypothetical protein
MTRCRCFGMWWRHAAVALNGAVRRLRMWAGAATASPSLSQPDHPADPCTTAGEWFILNTRSGFGDGMDRGRVFKMNTSVASRHPVRPGWLVQAARHGDDILDQVQLHSVFHAARIGGSDANGTPGSCLSASCDLLHRRPPSGRRYSRPGIGPWLHRTTGVVGSRKAGSDGSWIMCRNG